MKCVYSIPKSIKDNCTFTFCPGCDHGVAIKLVAQVLDELNLREKSVAVASSGCSVFLYDFLNVDCIESPHGRACAVATGIKRSFLAQNKNISSIRRISEDEFTQEIKIKNCNN